MKETSIYIGNYSIIEQPFNYGEDCWIGNYVHIRPFAKIGNKVHIRDHCLIDECIIGNNSRVYNHSYVCKGTVIGDNCFIGAGTMFCNDKEIAWPDQSKFICEPATVKDNVRIGIGCVILPGVVIAEGSRIGAGSVVTKDTFPEKTYVGTSAKILRMKKCLPN